MIQEPSLLTSEDVPATGMDDNLGIDNISDVVQLKDENDTVASDGIGDISTTFSPVWEKIVTSTDEEQRSSTTTATEAASNCKVVVDEVIDTDDHVDNSEDEDLSVTFSAVWEEIVIQPSSGRTTTISVVQESSSSHVPLPERPKFPSSRSSSSYSSTDIPLRGSQHDICLDSVLQSRTRMMEDSRSLDSMTVMYHSRDFHRHHNTNNSNENTHQNENDATDSGVLPSIVTFGSRINEDDDPAVQQPPTRATRLRYFRRICYWSLRLMCFPIWLLVSVFTVSTVIAFCILPGILIISIMISCYYCCSSDPIPFNVLMHALLLDDDNLNSENTNAPTRTKDEIRDLLICRTCIKSQVRRIAHDANDNSETPTAIANNTMPTIHLPDHEEIISHGPMYIATENYFLMFSDWSVPNLLKQEEVEIDVVQRPSLHLNSVENDHASASSVNAVQTLSSGSHNVGDDDVEVHADDYRHYASSDIEQGRNSVIEMASMQRTTDIDTLNNQLDAITFAEFKTKVKSTPNRILPLSLEEALPQDDDDDYFESGVGCDICLRRYQENDIVAWSHNAQCIHAYHLHCITDWLQKKITCPNCRSHYIPKHTNNHEHKRNVEQTQQNQIEMRDSNSTVTVPAASTTITTATGVAHNRSISMSNNAARTSAILQHQRSVTNIRP